MEFGVLAGYPMVGVKVTLLDGAYHEVDSSELAFKIAGSMAFKEAARKAGPVLLEPMMAVEVTTPEDYMGDVIGDLNSRRGQIQAMEERSGARVVKALVPLSEMFGYVGDLRSKTQGRASYTMQFDSYAEVPGQRGQGDHREGHGRVSTGTSLSTAAGGTRPHHHSARLRTDHDREDPSGEGEVRADQAARQHRHHRSHRPRQDDADRGDHQGAARQVPGPERGLGRSTRSTRLPRSGSAASRSRSRTSSTRPRRATTRTSTAPVTPTTSRT